MASNRGVAYIEPGKVEVKSIDYPKLKMPKSETDPFGGKDAPHGVILKIRHHQYLRVRPAHGARTDDGARRARFWAMRSRARLSKRAATWRC